MIFKTVTKIKDKKEISFFIEKINLFIKIVDAFKQEHLFNSDINNFDLDVFAVNRLIEIGVIDRSSEISALSTLLGEKVFIDLIKSVKFHQHYKDEMGNLLDKLDNTRRKEIQNEAKKSNKPKLVDFFCGAGGLSFGFIQEGFMVKLANDNQDVCCETYKFNHPELPSEKMIEGDIRSIVNNLDDFIKEDIDVVVGGPPCQGFSPANQQRIIDDPRNELYKYFIRALEKIAPKFVVMENVRGMLSVADQVVEDYKKLKINKDGNTYTYDVSYRILNSQNFSVAQTRLRLVFIAVRNDIAEKFKINPEIIYSEIEESCFGKPRFNLKDALDFIKPLEAPRIRNMNEIDNELTGKKVDANSFNGTENAYLRIINQKRSIPIIYNHKARFVSEINYEIYKRLNQGDDATNEKISDIMPYAHRNHLFKDKYFKLIADKPSRTITAHLKMDCHSHIHPIQARSITPREAARIQSFPDDYVFLGAYLKTYMQIGNAVPPVMARGIATVIKKYVS
jgi:DNA (cytosine-5)-methyltransferase 1